MLIRYFYFIYTLPLIVLHELSHWLVCKLSSTKIKKFGFTVDKKIYLLSGEIEIELPNKKWKLYLIAYSPIILFSPFLFVFLSKIFLWISLYLITTIVVYKKKVIWVLLPSSADLEYIKYWNFCEKKLLFVFQREELNQIIKNGNFKEVVKNIHILDFENYKQIEK